MSTIVVVDYRSDPTCSGALHIEAAERHVAALLAPYNRRLAEAMLEIRHELGFEIERALELPYARGYAVYMCCQRRNAVVDQIEAEQMLVNATRGTGPLRS